MNAQHPGLYRKRPVVVEAMLFDGENQDAMLLWLNGTDPATWPIAHYSAVTHTIKIVMETVTQVWIPGSSVSFSRVVLPGSWITKTPDGDLQVWTDEEFTASHDPEAAEQEVVET